MGTPPHRIPRGRTLALIMSCAAGRGGATIHGSCVHPPGPGTYPRSGSSTSGFAAAVRSQNNPLRFLPFYTFPLKFPPPKREGANTDPSPLVGEGRVRGRMKVRNNP